MGQPYQDRIPHYRPTEKNAGFWNLSKGAINILGNDFNSRRN